jgi:hypothetical protein
METTLFSAKSSRAWMLYKPLNDATNCPATALVHPNKSFAFASSEFHLGA